MDRTLLFLSIKVFKFESNVPVLSGGPNREDLPSRLWVWVSLSHTLFYSVLWWVCLSLSLSLSLILLDNVCMLTSSAVVDDLDKDSLEVRMLLDDPDTIIVVVAIGSGVECDSATFLPFYPPSTICTHITCQQWTFYPPSTHASHANNEHSIHHPHMHHMPTMNSLSTIHTCITCQQWTVYPPSTHTSHANNEQCIHHPHMHHMPTMNSLSTIHTYITCQQWTVYHTSHANNEQSIHHSYIHDMPIMNSLSHITCQ